MLSTEAKLLLVTEAIAVALLLICERANFRAGIAVSKITASICFIGLALSLGLLATPTGQILILGMILCGLGDALLLPTGQTFWFQLGIGASSSAISLTPAPSSRPVSIPPPFWQPGSR